MTKCKAFMQGFVCGLILVAILVVAQLLLGGCTRSEQFMRESLMSAQRAETQAKDCAEKARQANRVIGTLADALSNATKEGERYALLEAFETARRVRANYLSETKRYIRSANYSYRWAGVARCLCLSPNLTIRDISTAEKLEN